MLLGGCSAHTQAANPERGGPGDGRWRRAASHALASKRTWIPAAAAAVVAAGGWDDDVSEWAVSEAPLFGSSESAADAGDDLRTANHVGMIVTALVAPAGDRPWKGRLERLFWEHVGAVGTSVATSSLKSAVGRERPDASDDRSFPSGHSSRAFAYSAMSARNVRTMGLGRGSRIGLQVGLTGLAATAAWSRVEGGVHHLSDVLAGAALGSFVSQLVHEAFLDGDGRTAVHVQIDGRRFAVLVRRRL